MSVNLSKEKAIMSTIELREMLLEKISAIEDEELLHEIAHLIDVEPKITEGVYIMSPGEIAAVSEGIEQIENGMAVSNEDARKIFDKCLGK